MVIVAIIGISDLVGLASKGVSMTDVDIGPVIAIVSAAVGALADVLTQHGTPPKQ